MRGAGLLDARGDIVGRGLRVALAPGKPHFDPGHERRQFRVGQLAIGRHLNVAVVADGGDQAALVRLAGEDHLVGFRALEHGRAGVEPQTGLLFFGSVAREAPLGEHRPHAALEEALGLGCVVGICRGRRRLGGADNYRLAANRGECYDKFGEAQRHEFVVARKKGLVHPNRVARPEERRAWFAGAPRPSFLRACHPKCWACDPTGIFTCADFSGRRRWGEGAPNCFRPPLGAKRAATGLRMLAFYGLCAAAVKVKIRPRRSIGPPHSVRNPLIVQTLRQPCDRLAVIDVVRAIDGVVPHGDGRDAQRVVDRGRHVLRRLRRAGRIPARLGPTSR